MNFFEASDAIEDAIADAERTIEAVDAMAERMAKILVGRPRKASRYYQGAIAVGKLKRELRDFNIQTHRWKKP